MNELTYAFITPSYAPDFQRCKLLCWSIKQFVSFPIKHYIIVDRKDLSLFSQLSNSNTKILTKEEIIPSWIKRVPFFDKKNIWLNLRGYKSGNWLIRGWIIQQLIKLAAAEYVEEEVLIFVDSDVAFIDSFSIHDLVKSEKNQVRLFRIPHATDKDVSSDGKVDGRKWKEAAKRILDLPLENNYYDFYVQQIVTWRRSNLMKLYERIEEKFNENWLERIIRERHISEYVIYGLFVSYVLRDKSGHYDDHLQKICKCYWKEAIMSSKEINMFFQQAISSNHKAVMISAKSNINLSVEEFENILA